MCLQDTPTTGYYSALCVSNGDCGGGTVCDTKHEAVPRFDKANSGIAPTCMKKKSCTVCQGDWNCHSDYRCTKTAAGGRCAPPCATDGDCSGQDGNVKRLQAYDRKCISISDVKACTPDC